MSDFTRIVAAGGRPRDFQHWRRPHQHPTADQLDDMAEYYGYTVLRPARRGVTRRRQALTGK